VATAMLAEAEGDAARALEVMLGLWNHDLARETRYYHRYLGPPLVRLGVALGRTAVARQVVATVEEGAVLAPEVPTVQSCARRCHGLLDQDTEALIEAVEHARRGGRALDYAAAAILTAAGRPHDAKDLLIEAQDTYERVDAVAWSARVAGPRCEALVSAEVFVARAVAPTTVGRASPQASGWWPSSWLRA
jgi:hypothetical protein